MYVTPVFGDVKLKGGARVTGRVTINSTNSGGSGGTCYSSTWTHSDGGTITYQVPAHCTSITIKAWDGGGGSSIDSVRGLHEFTARTVQLVK